MESAGVGIFFTSITDFLAFMIGLNSPFGAIRGFCFFSAFGVVFDFIFQITFFIAFLVLQARRENAGGWCASCICSYCFFFCFTKIEQKLKNVFCSKSTIFAAFSSKNYVFCV